jgi:glucosylglycerate hydrolase
VRWSTPTRRDNRSVVTTAELAMRAAEVLRANDRGGMTVAAPSLYPHQWSWDAAFVTIGLAHVDVPRAITELRTLLSGQWATGMIPHIVFSPGEVGYFPDADRWDSGLAAAAPTARRTSGICQPPVHALALQAILDAGDRNGGDDREAAWSFASGHAFDALLAWHRWLATARDPEGTGLVTIHHGWESGMDNSPRWDEPYAQVRPGPDLPEFARRDTRHVADAAERPSDEEYARYLWLVEQAKQVRYDDAAMREIVDFRVADVFTSAVLSVAADVLAGIGDRLGRSDEAAQSRKTAARFRAGVMGTVSPGGLARDRDLRTGRWLDTDTIAGFAPLLCGAADAFQRGIVTQLLETFRGEHWCGHPDLAVPLPPSTSPDSAGFRPRTYWRGPVWPVVCWLFGWALRRHGYAADADRLRSAALDLLDDGLFGEYYDPMTGAQLGSRDQSWTAAIALDWVRNGTDG